MITPTPPPARAPVIFLQRQLEWHRDTDRLFVRLIIFQYLAGIAIALWISPRSWSGASSSVHPHVWAALLIGGLIAGLPATMVWKYSGTALTRHTIAAGQMLASGLLIHLTGGRIETHFHIFCSLALLAFYRDWKVLATASLVTAADHFLRSALWPESIFGVISAPLWRAFEHTGWVLFEDIFLVLSIVQNRRQAREIATRQAEDEISHANAESLVAERTRELHVITQRLMQKAAFQRTLLDNAGAAIIATTAEGLITHFNPAAERLLGYAATDAIGRLTPAPFHDAAEVAERATELSRELGRDIPPGFGVFVAKARAGQTETRDWTYVHKDGSRFPVTLTVTALHDAAGTISGFMGIARDITEQKKAAEALRQSEIRMKQAQRIAHIGNWELDLITGRLFWSDEIFRLFEIDPEQFPASYEGFLNVIHPDDRDLVNAAYTASLQNRQPYRITHRLRMPDGRIKHVEEQCETDFAADGSPLRSRGTVQDITRRTQAEAQLTAFKAALDEHAIVAITDARGHITYVNDKFCAISRYSREELLGQDHRIINSGHHSKDFIRALWDAISHGQVWHGEICNRAKDGSRYWVDTTIVPFLDDTGKPHQYVAIRADITARKAAHDQVATLLAQMEAANYELNNFAYVVSHDLKAPLRGISSLATWVADDHAASLSPEGREQLALLVGRTKRMNALIDGILAYSRAGRMREARVTTDLAATVREIISSLAPPPHIKVEIASPLPTVVCEPTRIAQVFQNLISNAIKYMDKPAGLVRIAAEPLPGDKGWRFAVADNGPGIEPRYHDKVFQLFQTLAARDDVESTGVGLSIVKKIIEGAGGRIWIESTPGSGATFYFTLPASSDALP